MPHILIFTTAYLPMVGGAEIAVQEITKRLSSRFRFTIITYRFSKSHPRQENKDGVEIIRLGNASTFDRLFIFPFRAFWAGRKLVKKENVKLLWGVMVSYASIGAYFLKKTNPSIPFLLTLQEGDSEQHIKNSRFGLISIWWKLLIQKADQVQVISNYLKKLALRNGARNVSVVPNGVGVEKFQITNNKFQINSNSQTSKKTIITTSRLVEKNGIDILIESIAVLTNKLPATSYKLRIVGDGPLRLDLEHSTKRLNIEKLVEFVGEVPPERIPAELAKANIFVRPSRSEGLGVSFLEAMAARLPIVATPVGGIPDFLAEGRNGLFTKVDDPKDLAEKLQLLLEKDDLARHLGESGRKLVEQKFNWDGITTDMSLIFKKLIVE